jgi:hypothetical protein
LPHDSFGTLSKRQILSADAVLVHWKAQTAILAIPHADRL